VLSRVEETKECHVTVLAQVDDVPDIERGVLQSQPADGHRPVTRELDAGLWVLPEQILDDADLVPNARQPRPRLLLVEASRYAREIGLEVNGVSRARRLLPPRA